MIKSILFKLACVFFLATATVAHAELDTLECEFKLFEKNSPAPIKTETKRFFSRSVGGLNIHLMEAGDKSAPDGLIVTKLSGFFDNRPAPENQHFLEIAVVKHKWIYRADPTKVYESETVRVDPDHPKSIAFDPYRVEINCKLCNYWEP